MARKNVRDRIFRQAERMQEARSGPKRLWAGMALVGSLGWMIALPAAGGAMLGHYLDQRLGTRLSFTLGLLLLGLAVGFYGVWRFFLREVWR